jgi:ligand-binding sensor domain-containing protein
LIWLLFSYQQVNSQAYDFTQYGIEQGIAHEQITDICQDIKGNLWIATQGGGVSKFNGISFKNYTVRDGLLSNYVRSLTTDAEGNVWMATAEGITMYNGAEIENSPVFQNTLKKSVNTILKDSKGKLWYATADQGVSVINQDGVTQFYNQTNGFVNDRVIDIKEGWDGSIWLVTIVNGVYQYENGKFIRVVSTSDVKGYILSITIRDEHIILATNRGLFKYDQQLSPIKDFDKMFVKSIVSRNNELWAITANSLVRNRNGQNTEFSPNAGFSSKLPTVGYYDREGNLWIGTNGEGLYKFASSTFVKFDNRHGLKNEDIFSIVMDDNGKYWFGTNGGGVYSYDGEEMINYTTADGLPNNYITSSALHQTGDIWLGTRGGVVNYNGKRFKTYLETDGLGHNNVRSIYCSNNGDVWIASVHGLSKWNGHSFQNYTTENGLLDDVVWDIFEHEGGTYFVTRKGVNVLRNGLLQEFYKSEEVFNKRVNTIRFSMTGELLVGYSGYGFRIINLNEGLASDTWISSEDGLISDIIHNIEQIDSTKFLVTTDRGID